MPFFLAMIVTLIICWAMMLNIAKLVLDRMVLQNAADNAVMSVAVCKARLLNRLGQVNYLMACALYGSENGFGNYCNLGFTLPLVIYGVCFQVVPFTPIAPADYELFEDTQQRVGCMGDVIAKHPICPGNEFYSFHSSDTCIKKFVKGVVHMGIIVQEALKLEFKIRANIIANSIATRQQINSQGENVGADYATVITPNSILLEELQRNMNGVGYCKSNVLCVSSPWCPGLPSGFHTHVFWTELEPPEKNEGSWLYADRECFDKNQKIILMAVKNGNSSSNRGFPLFARWLGIEWPTITTVASARVYNRNGPMFTLETKGSPSDQISPVIRAYKDAQYGGWDAQLVPCNYMEIQH